MDQITQQLQNINVDPPSTNWFDLPAEMREMVIDRMDPKTRGKFAQCSKICETEVKNSKFYLTAISIEKAVNLQLFISHEDNAYNHSLEFMDVPGLTFPQSIVYYTTFFDSSKCTSDRVINWKKTENGNVEDVRKRYITATIEKYKKSINKFVITDSTCSMVDINLKSLRNLKQIWDFRYLNAEDLIAIGSLDVKQIHRMDTVQLPYAYVKFEDVLKFKGSRLLTRSDDFDLKNIKQYLKMWKNGEIHENVKDVTVGSNKFEGIERQKITEGLDVFDYKDYGEKVAFGFHSTNDTNKKWVTYVNFTENYLKLKNKFDQ